VVGNLFYVPDNGRGKPHGEGWLGEVDLLGWALSNQPMNLTVPPQGHRSIIETPELAAVPQVIGKALDNRGRDCGRGSSGGEGPRLSAAIVFSPAGALGSLSRWPSCL
jgi:hypothetical protein